MLGIKRLLVPGFSLVQLVIALAIIGIITAVAMPAFLKRRPLYEERAFVTNLNALMAEAWQQGLMTQKLQKVVFDVAQRTVTFEEETKEVDTQGNLVFKPVVVQYIPSAVIWPESMEIKQFFIQGVDEFTANRTTNFAWFFIKPDGMAQEVVINIEKMRAGTSQSEERRMSLVLNPFTAQFKVYDEFRTPS